MIECQDIVQVYAEDIAEDGDQRVIARKRIRDCLGLACRCPATNERQVRMVSGERNSGEINELGPLTFGHMLTQAGLCEYIIAVVEDPRESLFVADELMDHEVGHIDPRGHR